MAFEFEQTDKEFIASVKLVRFLAALRACGYKEVWINTESPYSRTLKGISHVIVTPKIKDIPLWRMDEFPIGCGNGIEGADQAQIWSISDIPPGHYTL